MMIRPPEKISSIHKAGMMRQHPDQVNPEYANASSPPSNSLFYITLIAKKIATTRQTISQ
jgi:hypothetical protein